MQHKFIRINDDDNVLVVLEELKKNTEIEVDNLKLKLLEDIPKGHKVALKKIGINQEIIKYGYVIGHAVVEILPGEWVHSHNIKTNLKDLIEYSYNPFPKKKNIDKNEIPFFKGYKRKDGRVGTRNEIWIINTVGCVNTSAEKIAKICNEKFKRDNFDGVFSFSHPYGCSQLGDDLKNTQKILAGLIKNPNAGGVLIIGLGCENNQLKFLLEKIEDADMRRIKYFISQEVYDEIEEGVRLVNELFNEMKNDKREICPISKLVLGMKCGGSDGFSGITANPLVGRISDLLSSFGGSVLLTEVPEMFGAEQQLMNRAANRKIYEKIVWLINNFKEYFLNHHQPVYENPSPGNKEGGITTLEEKSLGAIQKGGSALIEDVLEYGETCKTKGLSLLMAPGNDGISATALTASGATIILFTTGRGTPLGFPVPTIKISTNSFVFERKLNWIDFDAGQILNDNLDLNTLTNRFFNYIIKVASGEIKTKNEINGYKEIAIWKNGVTL
jgi:altronate hydrolase